MKAIVLLAPWLLFACQDGGPPVATFGTTVVIPSGLRGEVYHIPSNSRRLPNFAKLKSRGSIYTASLNIPTRNFREGFPGVTKRFEWFALDYSGKFWIEKPGDYRFFLMSDDGSKLYLDDRLAIDNDGIHAAAERTAAVTLEGGIHRIRVSYFQGPRLEVALVLRIAGPGEKPRIFSTDEFRPPPNPDDWKWRGH
jgi:hypothetical protein